MFLEIHNDPDRLDRPLKRMNPRSELAGQFEETSWDAVLSDLGQRLRTIREKHGPDSIAVYTGNPNAFDSRSFSMLADFHSAIGTRMRFNAGTQDCINKLFASHHIYGSVGSLMVPDLYHTDYLLCIGANPRISHWTAISVPNDSGKTLKRIRARGGNVVFVNPRKIESSTAATGETHHIRPDTDVYFLAALIHEIHENGGFDEHAINRYGKNLRGLVEFAGRYPATRVEKVTGLPADLIRQIAADLSRAASACVYISTGVHQGRQGTLCAWLSEMLNFVTGNLGRKGGTYKPLGINSQLTPLADESPSLNTSLGNFDLPDWAALPAALLPDFIEHGDIRCLINLSGNPLLSVGGEERLRRAFEKLDLLLTVDILRNDVAELSDYVLAATDWLEREDINLLADSLQLRPYVQYTEAMVQPVADRRPDWWILARIMQELGAPSPLDKSSQNDGFDMVDNMLAARGLSIEKLKKMPHQTAILDDNEHHDTLGRCLLHGDQRVDCCPPVFSESGLFTRCKDIFAELSAESTGILKLIGLRTNYMHNSWLSNSPGFRKGSRAENPLHMCEQDASVLQLSNGDRITVSTRFGEIETTLELDEKLRPGVVGLSHGYGHRYAFAMREASRKPGANYNRLVPTGTEAFEPFSYMSWLSGIPVEIRKRN